MTLKEKFQTKEMIQYPYESIAHAYYCEQIADSYAIEFAEWITQQSEVNIIKKSGLGNSYMKMNSKELLEIFKKEKGL